MKDLLIKLASKIIQKYGIVELNLHNDQWAMIKVCGKIYKITNVDISSGSIITDDPQIHVKIIIRGVSLGDYLSHCYSNRKNEIE